MSEKLQHTAVLTRETMMHRYGDVYHHKHDKRHTPYRLHCRSHLTQPALESLQPVKINSSTGWVRETNLRKFRKQLAKRSIH